MDGILPLWKPKGFTSHDCVSKARGMLKTKKIGHTGTLDPAVEGVLPLCVGKATKIVPFLTDTDKVYEAEITLGAATDTEDATGVVIEKTAVKGAFSDETLQGVLSSFKGYITQTPPMYSAVKVKGKKLYEYAREGIEVDRPSREVLIKQIEWISSNEHPHEDTFSFSFRVVCSKGTYIRTLCVDIGKALGYPSHMSALIRTKTADISTDDCYSFEELQRAVDEGRGEELLLPLSRGLGHMDSWEVNEEMKEKIKHGQVWPKPSELDAARFTVTHAEEVLAIYQQHPDKPGLVKPVRVF
ncbi:tRNA pseudouridine synthase B [Halobacillus karajensis]|uniref:tRNA pseudouridine synthase B n=1 Tax=Halobacillus karajensis TaxID=195088 RepID=A0A024P1X8_9BACI|nr:tRNA pseudouridine(55) synthase TruB [Halobacillus karajensis]CDQ19700.1 tRNA pseudouridine synthase B [Halobacillus karajensis]CDQ22160.1 tRNA pseudouridine synthase B [Halobacillus karajensis]CDQ28001.1 tRNA pseudouridine synthase B [Halobacillus karajensis]SEH73631.1 tRNA pseudouridine synthase B [Halobacillus karajensis]